MDPSDFRILIVDHNQDLIDSLRQSLEFYHYQVESLTSSAQALLKIAHRHFDLVISDVNMPEISGLELLKRTKTTIRDDLPFILITGEIRAEHAVEAVRLGAADFIGKPIDINHLLRSIDLQVARKENRSLAYATRVLRNIHLDFEFYPSRFVERDLTNFVTTYLGSMYNFPASVINSVHLCLDEMLHNAFIHGTLELTREQRELPHNEYITLIDKLTQNAPVNTKAIRLRITINTADQVISISVTDQGRGFHYPGFTEDEGKTVTLDSSGRGLRFIHILSDSVELTDGGRTITISKRFENS